jgi:hypothetical protein
MLLKVVILIHRVLTSVADMILRASRMILYSQARGLVWVADPNALTNLSAFSFLSPPER